MAGVYRKSRLSGNKQLRLMEHFVAGTTARIAAELVGVNLKTAAYYFHRLREIIEQASEDATPLSGEIEIDESYFGGSRKGKRGRGAAGKDANLMPNRAQNTGFCRFYRLLPPLECSAVHL